MTQEEQQTRTADDYYAFADNDVHWQMARASAKLEGIELTAKDDLLAGQCAAGDITIDGWIGAIVKDFYPNGTNFQQ